MFVTMLRFFREEVVHRFKNAPMRVGILMFAVLCYSTTGFLFFEIQAKPDLTWWDAVWWSVVTMTTVGYGDLFPQTWGGRIFVAIPTMMIGIGLLGFVLSVVATALIEARSNQLRGLAKIHMKKHIVICNYPSEVRVLDLVEQVRADHSTATTPIVLVDDDLDEISPSLSKRGVTFVRGDPAKAETLQRACIKDARAALVLAKDQTDARSDHTGLAILLTIETLQSAVFSVAELVDIENKEFFERTGCDSIVCLNSFTTHVMVQELLDPGVQGVIGQLTDTNYGQQICVVAVETDASASFGDAQTWAAKHDALLIGYERGKQQEMTLNPALDTKLKRDDRLVLIAARRPPAFQS